MTLNELINIAGNNPLALLIIFIILPMISFLLPFMHGRTIVGRTLWRYVYTILVYIVCFPGILSAVLISYVLFFTRANLMNVNVLVYFLPIISMTITLIVIRKNVSFNDIPGFDRIYGLIVMIGITFVLILAIEKTRIWLFFGSSIFALISIVIGLFTFLKWGSYMLFRHKDEPIKKSPSFPYR